ncbi:hypothetical protein V2J09_001121 [Rumex salicifolius]
MAISSSSLYLPLNPKISPSFSLSSSNSSFISPSCRFFGPSSTSNRALVARTRPGNGRRKRFSCSCFFGLGVPELAVIAGVAALVFGPKKLPEVGRSIGKTVKSFQQAAKEFESELKKDPEPLDEESTAVSQEKQEDPSTVTKDSI